MPLSALTGTRLRERRQALGLRQADLAARVGISASYLNLIEHNRRRIADALLFRLAGALDVSLDSLQESHAEGRLDVLRAAAAEVPGAGAELERVDELVGRFPGWAATLAELHDRSRALVRVVEVLNDRMAHDPHLSASLHEVLSAVSSVRTTAAILADTDDIDPAWRQRFHKNLHADSERLAQGAEALVAYLDGAAPGQDQSVASPQEEVEAWAEACDWMLTEAEDLTQSAHLASGAGRALAQGLQAQMASDVAALPEPDFSDALAQLGPDPLALAQSFGAPVLAAFRRIALRPGSGLGLLVCDGSGTLVLRKTVAGFSPPRFGAACPLWPLFTALTRPETPVEAVIALPGPQGARFRVRAFCQTRFPGGFRGPELREAAMLVQPEPAGPDVAIEVGPTCRICPRADCPARREPSILRSELG
ncbi:helix-turn-helix domain-containing protein [Tabrizicola sp.]|uniref:helix-turn-helix domain-containing protein n=1 Tax=Tabrizicola sp. TaxID=2005166 RepID=UPI003D29C6DA